MAHNNILTLLPTELIDAVVAHIKNGNDRASFSKACRAFHESCSNTLVESIDIEFDGWHISNVRGRPIRGNPVLWTSNIARIERNGWNATVNPTHLCTYSSPYNNIDSCSIDRCRECTLTRTLGLANALLASQMHKMSTTYRSLTFRGSFGEQSRTPNVDTGVSRHHLIDAYGLAALAPHEFEFNMRWQLWDIAILHELSVSKLVKLKLPLGVPSDCFELGCTLRRMSSLKSLTITDIPDHPLFLKNLPYLGLGILSRGASLRELDIWITNYNRPDYYCDTFERVTIEDEAFVKPDSLDWFFGLLFPQSPEDIEDDQREKYLTFKDSISREQGSLINKPRPLKLEKLRFRHVDLPLYAFEDIVDGSFLKELSLPFCDVEQGTWQRIGTTGLVRIADLNYDLLSEELIRFLSAQTSLKSLTFARPADECTASGFVQYPGDESPTLFLQLSKRTPMLGQGTEWGRNSIYGQRLATLRNGSYPSLEELLASISSTELKELYMPADMYDITPVAFSMIGSKLAYLEHLSWGFDYCSPRIRNAFLESFLPKMHCLRRITFLSVNLPSGWNDLQGDSLAFEATMFHDFMRTVSGSIPNILRHVRYQHLIPRDSCGAQQTGTYYYCRQERKDERRWMRLNMLEGEKLFDGDLTPQVV